MGVYYKAYMGYGLLVNEDELPDHVYFYELIEELDLPLGFDYVFGGDMMNDKGTCALIGPKNLLHEVLHSMTNEFGAIRLIGSSEGMTPEQAYPVLRNLALEIGVDPDVGYFGISSVG